MIDFNCYIGTWPFFKIRKNSFEDLKNLHQKNGINEAYVSSLNSVFYNDPYEGDLDLRKEVCGEGYHIVQTLNPMLPGSIPSLERGISELKTEGVKVFPGFHGYDLNCPEMKALTDKLREYKLPLFIVLRGDDERFTYMFAPGKVEPESIRKFVYDNRDLEIYLCNIKINEVGDLKDMFLELPNVYYDFSGLKGGVFPEEKLEELGVSNKGRYGSMWPLYCMKSSLLTYTNEGNL